MKTPQLTAKKAELKLEYKQAFRQAAKNWQEFEDYFKTHYQFKPNPFQLIQPYEITVKHGRYSRISDIIYQEDITIDHPAEWQVSVENLKMYTAHLQRITFENLVNAMMQDKRIR